MRDLIWVAIIVFWVVAVRLTRRTAFWEPRTVMVGGVATLPDQRPMGFMILLCLLGGLATGAMLPSMIQDNLPTGRGSTRRHWTAWDALPHSWAACAARMWGSGAAVCGWCSGWPAPPSTGSTWRSTMWSGVSSGVS